ncbi:MAG: 4'-phosphopantetheinyl transferase family protein [Chitinophagaceae bacterium]
MPLVRTIQIDQDTKLGIWHIAEQELFFQKKISEVPLIRHWHKRLQFFATRYLLTELFPEFPMEKISVNSQGKPFLEGNTFYFSFSHCGDYAAAIISKNFWVGVDIERIRLQVGNVITKFLSLGEISFLDPSNPLSHATICWSAKEAVYKWHGERGMDFRNHIHLHAFPLKSRGYLISTFSNGQIRKELTLQYLFLGDHVLCWLADDSSQLTDNLLNEVRIQEDSNR